MVNIYYYRDEDGTLKYDRTTNREIGTVKEALFDAYVVNETDSTFTVDKIRFGAGSSRTITVNK